MVGVNKMAISAKKLKSPGEETKTFQQQAYSFVKTRVMNRDLKPGQYITDNQIGNELNISRTPVREALRLLEHEGFLFRQARRGWRVYSLSLEDINEIFDIKETLEGVIVKWAVKCNDKGKRATLKEEMKRMKQATSAHDHEAWRQTDMELHRIIFSMCGNERASRIINDLNDQWYRVRIGLVAMQGRMERSTLEHEAIVESILAGNGDGAERLMRNHLNNLRQELVRVLVNLVLPFAQNGV
jgi:DNA-binding GntR family transcriptional regulator